MGRIEIFLIVIVLVIGGWFGASLFRGNKAPEMCTPVPLSQEVKAYIDSKLVSNAGSQCSEIPVLVTKLTELQTKLGAIELYRYNLELRKNRADALAGVSARIRASAAASVQRARTGEIDRVKSQITNMCSGLKSGAKIPKSGRPNVNENSPVPSIPGDDPVETKAGAGSEDH